MKLKNYLKRLFAIHPLLYKSLYKFIYFVKPRQLSYRLNSKAERSSEVFNEIFEKNLWQSSESLSGAGSTVEATSKIRASLPLLLKEYHVKILLDAPCGDFHWMKLIKLPEGTNYIGGELVAGLVENLRMEYQSDIYEFIHLDIINSTLPQADLWLCRETLFHFPEQIVKDVLFRFCEFEIKYLLTTTFDFVRTNVDISFGDFRMINLRKPPFSLPRPLKYVDDFMPGEAPRQLGLWSREQLIEWKTRMQNPGGS